MNTKKKMLFVSLVSLLHWWRCQAFTNFCHSDFLKYLGRKHNMAAKNEEEQIRMDLIEAEAIDMRTKWSTLCYIADFVSNIYQLSLFFMLTILIIVVINCTGKNETRILEKCPSEVKRSFHLSGESSVFCRTECMMKFSFKTFSSLYIFLNFSL